MSNSGWNRASVKQPTKKGGGGKPTPMRGVIAGVVVAVALGAAWFLIFSGGETRQDATSTKRRERIKEVTPAAAPKYVEVEKPVEKKKPTPYWELPTTNGLNEIQQRKWRDYHMRPSIITNTTSWTEKPPVYAIFNHPCENRIAAYLTIEPGQGMVGTPVYDESFEREFLKSCEEPIIITEEDDDYSRKLKEDMRQVKIDIRNRMANGEKVGDILSETHREIQKLAIAKREIESIADEMLRGDSVTKEDADNIIEAANKMLEQKGIAPMEKDSILTWNLRRRIMKRSGAPDKE